MTSADNDSKKIENIAQRIAKLLDTAESYGDSPAAETYRQKAYALSAQYGVEAAERMGDEAYDMLIAEYDMVGSYTDMQANLLHCIADALHCYVVVQRMPRSSKVAKATVFGKARHIERVEMLFEVLNDQMVNNVESAYSEQEFVFNSATKWKRSYMIAFMQRIHVRVKEAEDAVADGYADDDTSGALVLVSDASEAQDAAHDEFDNIGTAKKRKRTVDVDAYARGDADGQSASMGEKPVSA